MSRCPIEWPGIVREDIMVSGLRPVVAAKNPANVVYPTPFGQQRAVNMVGS